MPRIEPGGDCRRCGAPAERYTWTFNAQATHAQYRGAAGHLTAPTTTDGIGR